MWLVSVQGSTHWLIFLDKGSESSRQKVEQLHHTPSPSPKHNGVYCESIFFSGPKCLQLLYNHDIQTFANKHLSSIQKAFDFNRVTAKSEIKWMFI